MLQPYKHKLTIFVVFDLFIKNVVSVAGYLWIPPPLSLSSPFLTNYELTSFISC